MHIGRRVAAAGDPQKYRVRSPLLRSVRASQFGLGFGTLLGSGWLYHIGSALSRFSWVSIAKPIEILEETYFTWKEKGRGEAET